MIWPKGGKKAHLMSHKLPCKMFHKDLLGNPFLWLFHSHQENHGLHWLLLCSRNKWSAQQFSDTMKKVWRHLRHHHRTIKYNKKQRFKRNHWEKTSPWLKASKPFREVLTRPTSTPVEHVRRRLILKCGTQVCKTKLKRRLILKCGRGEKGTNRRKRKNKFILVVKTQRTEKST